MARLTFTDDQVLALAGLLTAPTVVAYCDEYDDPAAADLAKIRDFVSLRAEDIVNEKRARRRLRLVPLTAPAAEPVVHTHGTEDGPGLACNERLVDGQLYGACQPDPPRTEKKP